MSNDDVLGRMPPRSRPIGDISIQSAIMCLEGLKDSIDKCDFNEMMNSVRCAGEHLGRLDEWIFTNRNRMLITQSRVYREISKMLDDTLYEELVRGVRKCQI
jgi:hypothetical protein